MSLYSGQAIADAMEQKRGSTAHSNKRRRRKHIDSVPDAPARALSGSGNAISQVVIQTPRHNLKTAPAQVSSDHLRNDIQAYKDKISNPEVMQHSLSSNLNVYEVRRSRK